MKRFARSARKADLTVQAFAQDKASEHSKLFVAVRALSKGITPRDGVPVHNAFSVSFRVSLDKTTLSREESIVGCLNLITANNGVYRY